MFPNLSGAEFSQAMPLSDLEQAPPPFLTEESDRKVNQIKKKTLESSPLSSKVKNGLSNTEVKIISSNKIETTLRSVQYYINDMVLKGTSYAVRFFAPTTNDLTADYLEFVINTVDIGLGIPNLIQKSRILEKSETTLKELRKNANQLNPSQLKRLDQLEKFVNYHKSVISDLMAEQGLRISRSTLANVRLVGTFFPDLSLFQTLMAPLELLIGGINVLISGLFFQQSLDHLQLQNLWFKENPDLFLPPLMNQQQASALQQKRLNARSQAEKKLKEQLNTGELTREQIITSLKRAKIREFRSILSNPPLTVQQIKDRLQKECWIPFLNSELEEIQKTILKNQEQELLKIQEILNQHIQKWLDNQSDETLIDEFLSRHATTATIDPLIKGAVVDMVKKKHEIEREFLILKVKQNGVSFAFAGALFVTGLVLLLIALAATPVGPAAIIILCLTIASIASSAAFLTAGVALAYNYKPGLTTASFKGAYIKLIFYYAMHYLQSAKNSLVGYFTKFPPAAIQDKQIKTLSWLEKAAELQEKIEQIAWQDFAKEADLKVDHPSEKTGEAPWDTLEALDEALNRCDFNLLCSETKELLEKQLGFNLSIIEEEIAKDPLIIKKTLRNFFNLDNTAFVEFMGKQRGNIS